MLQPGEAVTALSLVAVSLYGWRRGCDTRWCVLVAGTGGGSFSWHAWGVLYWGTATDDCTGGEYPSKVNPHPWLMTLDATLTTMLSSHMVTLAIRPSSPSSLLWTIVNESLLVATLVVISTQERGDERYDVWLAGILVLWLVLLFVYHTRRDRGSASTWAILLVAGVCKGSELLLQDESWFRSALHAAWHVSSALASLNAVLLCQPIRPSQSRSGKEVSSEDVVVVGGMEE